MLNCNRCGSGAAEVTEAFASAVLGDRWPISFSRNLAPVFTHYLSERPEMIPQDESSRKAKTTRKKNKMTEKKANKTIKARDLKKVSQKDSKLSKRIDAARDSAGLKDRLALQLNIVPGLNFFWD
jgi:hypothetical protein